MKGLGTVRGVVTATGGAMTPRTARSGSAGVVTVNAVALVAAPSEVARLTLAVPAGPGIVNVTSVADEATTVAGNAPTLTIG